MKNKVELACIIDDDQIYVNLIKKVIETRQLCQKLLIFNNGKEALNYFDTLPQKTPDIIFVDLNMPIMDGWEFLENFIKTKNKLNNPITIYVVSSSINPMDIKRAKQITSVTDYIIKPITIENLEKIFTDSIPKAG